MITLTCSEWKSGCIKGYRNYRWIVLEYGSTITNNCSASDSLKLEKVQRTAALICTGAMRRTETKLLFDFLGWEDLSDRRRITKAVLFYKIVNNLTPVYLKENLTFNENVRYQLRTTNSKQIKPYHCRLTIYKNSFFPQCIKLWNSLPENIILSENIFTFKKRIKEFIDKNIHRQTSTSLEHFHDGFFGSLLTQIKLKLSPLKAQLFSYNLTDNPFCPSCGQAIETVEHYFVECASYDVSRIRLLMNLFRLEPSLTVDNASGVIHFIVHGSSGADKNKRVMVNREIFRHVKIYFATTGRFSIWHHYCNIYFSSY